ncbi:hypothetical protein DFS34DRAFT_606980 [Phlyctochytrium arcticum]|nr:hypothetical protein DFS34DRAFT_606980 [Phlyctochytrium arcticum]
MGIMKKPARKGAIPSLKETRGFKFKKYSKTVQKEHVGVFKQVKEELNVANHGKDWCHINSQLEVLSESICTGDFVKLAQNLRPLIGSLMHVLLNQEKIKEILVEALNQSESLAIGPAIQLFTAFAKDLQDDFSPYNKDFLVALTPILQSSDVELSKAAFGAFGSIYKNNQQFLAPDILEPSIGMVINTLGSTKAHTRRFSAETFGMLLQSLKLADFASFIDQLLSELPRQEISLQSVTEPLSDMFLESFKLLDGDFTHDWHHRFRLVLDMLDIEDDDSIQLLRATVFKLVKYGNGESLRPLLDILLRSQLANKGAEDQKFSSGALIRLLPFFRTWTTYNHGDKLLDKNELLAALESLILEDMPKDSLLLLPPSSNNEFIATVSELICISGSTERERLHGIIKLIFEEKRCDIDTILRMCAQVRSNNGRRFTYVLSDILKRTMQQQWGASRLNFQTFIAESCEVEIERYTMNILDEPLNFDFVPWTADIESVVVQDIARLKTAIMDSQEDRSAGFPQLAVLCAYLNAAPISGETILTPLIKLFIGLLQSTSKARQTASPEQSDGLGRLLVTIVILFKRSSGTTNLAHLTNVVRDDFAPHVSQAREALRGLLVFLNFMKGSKPSELPYSDKFAGDVLDHSRKWFSHHECQSRLLALYCAGTLVSWERSLPADSIDGAKQLLDVLADIENSPWDGNSVRGKVMLLRRAERLLQDTTLPSRLRKTLLSYFLGLLKCQLTPLWPEIIKVMQVCVSSEGVSYWKLVEEQLTDTLQYHDGGPITPTALPETVSEVSCQAYHRQRLLLSKQTDPVSYCCQLLKLFSNSDKAMINSSALLINSFRRYVALKSDEEEQSAEKDDDVAMEPRSRPRRLIMEFLRTFAAVKTPAKLTETDSAYECFLQLLGLGSLDIQKLALDCVLNWQRDLIDPQAGQILRTLTDDKTFRSTLLSADIEFDAFRVSAPHADLFGLILGKLLFGRMTSRRGRNSARANTVSSAILAYLASEYGVRFVLPHFLELVVVPLREKVPLSQHSELEARPGPEFVQMRKVIGALTVLSKVISSLAKNLEPFSSLVFEVLNNAFILARSLTPTDGTLNDNHHAKQVTSLALQSTILLFEKTSVDLADTVDAFITNLYEHLINPRLANFSVEHTQNPSKLLKLFICWSSKPEYIRFVFHQGDNVLLSVLGVLENDSVASTVVFAIFDMLESLIANESLDNLESPLWRNLSTILRGFRCCLERDVKNVGKQPIARTVTWKVIQCLKSVAPLVENSTETDIILDILLPFTKRPDKTVPEFAKVDILRTFAFFVPKLDSIRQDGFLESNRYRTISHLFLTLHSREGRIELANVFAKFSEMQPVLLRTNECVQGLNAFSRSRLDEPDFDARFNALEWLAGEQGESLSPGLWIPLLYNLLFFLLSKDDFSIRASASTVLEKFIQSVATEDLSTVHEAKSAKDVSLGSLVVNLIIPNLRHGIASLDIAVRQDHLQILERIVLTCHTLPDVQDMMCLTADGDDEASFFRNIHHMQTHRRARAMKRLAAAAAAGSIGSRNLNGIFVPLLVSVIFDKNPDHNLVNEAIASLGICAQQLQWTHYYALLKRLKVKASRAVDNEKTMFRTMSIVLEAFAKFIVTSPEVKADDDNESEEVVEDGDDEPETEQISISTPANGKASRVLLQQILPDLLNTLSQADDDNVEHRIVLGIAACKVLSKLPPSDSQLPISRLIVTVVLHLRSRKQDVRDRSRETLCGILSILGMRHLHFVIQEMMATLARGYQKHVLVYTIHNILSQRILDLKGNLMDETLKNICNVALGDIFGQTGQEKEIQGLKGKMREMKGSKGNDILEILAQSATVGQISALLLPLKEILFHANTTAISRKLEEALKRLASGLRSNTNLNQMQLLLLGQKLLQEFQLSNGGNEPKSEASGLRNMKWFHTHSYVFVQFGLWIIQGQLMHETRAGLTPELEEILAQVNKQLVRYLTQDRASLRLTTVQLLNTIIQLLPESLASYAVNLVDHHLSFLESYKTQPELANAAARFIALVLRSLPDFKLSAFHTTAFCTFIKGQIAVGLQHDQLACLNLLRELLGRKCLVSDIFEIMDDVGRAMVTSSADQVRVRCQLLFMQYLLSYPIGTARLRKQIASLVHNLSYNGQGGRISVLKTIGGLLQNLTPETIAEYVEAVFLALCNTLVEDESPQCRKLAGENLTLTIKACDENTLAKLKQVTTHWFQQENKVLVRVAAQVSMYFIADDTATMNGWTKQYIPLLERTLLSTCSTVRSDEEFAEDWRLGYQCLGTLERVFGDHPQLLEITESNRIWETIVDIMNYPHAWIRLSCNRLLGLLFTFLDTSSTPSLYTDTTHILLRRKYSVRKLTNRLCGQLTIGMTEDFAAQVHKNLLFLTKCLVCCETQQSSEDPDNDNPLLPLIFTELSNTVKILAEKCDFILLQTVLQWYAAANPLLSVADKKTYLPSMLRTMNRISVAATRPEDPIHGVIREVRDALSGSIENPTVGQEHFLNTDHEILNEAKNKREARRSQQKAAAITQSGEVAKRKIQRNLNKRKRIKEISAQHKSWKQKRVS